MNSIITFIISVAVIIVIAILTLLFENKTKWEGHDERQILISLKSSTIGFYSLLVFCLIDFMAIRTFELPFKPEILIIFSIFVSFTIFIVREIWFCNMQSNVISPRIIFLFVTVFLAITAAKLFKAYFAGSGALENLLIASSMTLCYLICSITIAIRYFINRKNASGDEN